MSHLYVNHKEHSEFLIAFGKRIEEIRKNQGLTKIQLAFEMNTGEKYIRRIEKGEVNITIKNLLKLSNALHIPLPELLSV